MDTRDRLISSTQELMWERGYVGMSPKDIQSRANAGQGSMYHHFTGKADLALAALRRSGETLQGQADVQLSAPGSAVERITAYLRKERNALRGCPIGRMAQDPDIVADKRLRQPVAETLAWITGRLEILVREGQAAREFPQEADPKAVAAALVAALQGAYVLARAAGSTRPYAQAIEGAVTLLRALASAAGHPGRSPQE